MRLTIECFFLSFLCQVCCYKPILFSPKYKDIGSYFFDMYDFFLLVKIVKVNVSKYSFPSLKESNRKLDTIRDNVT